MMFFIMQRQGGEGKGKSEMGDHGALAGNLTWQCFL